MTTRILDIEIDRAGLAVEGLEGYDRALFLVRHRGEPLGQVTVPVRGGRIAAGAVRAALPADLIARWAAREEAPEPDRPAEPLTATVAICTRERPEDLARALASLMAMPRRGAGVLVVDNAPKTDATREVVARFPEVRYVVEPRRGLNNARNRALAECATDVVAFTDDDVVADPGWLDGLLAGFTRPDIGCVCGLTMPLELENAAQEEFEALAGFSQRGFRRREFASPPCNPLATGGIGAGANMALRRSVLAGAGLFDPLLDGGMPTLSGGDHEYMSRVLRAGWTIVYEPRALNWHRHRRTREELIQTVHGYGVGVYSFYTRAFLVERDRGVVRMALGWLRHQQLPDLARALLRRRGAKPLDVVWAELSGCARGPFPYLRARRAARGTAS